MRAASSLCVVTSLLVSPLHKFHQRSARLIADGGAALDADALQDVLARELPQLSSRTAAEATAAAPSIASANFVDALEQLEAVGMGRADVTALIRRRPKSALTLLARRQPAQLLDALAALGVCDVGAVLRAQPRVLELDVARLAESVVFLEGYVGAGRVGEFVSLHPQALLWGHADDLPVAQHLRALGISKAVIEKVRKGLPTIDSLTSADNVAALLDHLTTELSLSTGCSSVPSLTSHVQCAGRASPGDLTLNPTWSGTTGRSNPSSCRRLWTAGRRFA